MENEVYQERTHKEPKVNVRFSEREFARVEKMALTMGLSIPALLRKVVLKRFDLERPLYSADDAQRIISELNRHGNNLNQIARKINAGIATGWNQAFNGLTRAYVDLRRAITVNRANS